MYIRPNLLLLTFILALAISLVPHNVQAQACSYHAYGDANCDNTFNAEDYVIWKNEYLKTISTKTADFSGEGIVSLVDLQIYIQYLLKGLPVLTNAPSATPSPTVTQTGSVPADVLNLTNWKLTLPIGPSENPTEIKQGGSPALANYVQEPWFVVNPGGGVRFRAAVNGTTTSGSDYPRSELREMTNAGKDNANWSSSSGVHTMIIEEAITALPQLKPHVVAGQIHDASNDIIVIRLEGQKLFIDIGGADGPTLDASYSLGKRFAVKFEVSNGVTNVYYGPNINALSLSYSLNKSYSGAYFKAGVYTQSACKGLSVKGIETNCADSNYGEVVIYNVEVTHR